MEVAGVDAAAASAGNDGNEGNASSVGVLGWLGFVIINIAAWGIIGTASAINWVLGFVITCVYTGILIGMAFCLRRYGPKYFSFENLLWVLACWFFFILGMYIVVNLIGPAFDEDRALSPENSDPWVTPIGNNNDLQALLPEGSSDALVGFAGDPDWRVVNAPTFADFDGVTFFNGQADGSTSEVLRRSGGEAVAPALLDARSFVIHNGDLYVLAREKVVAGGQSSLRRGLWSIRAGAHGVAEYIGGPQSLGINFYAVYGEAQLASIDGGLYFKAEFECASVGWTKSIFHLNMTGSTDTVDDLLRSPVCPIVEVGETGEAGSGAVNPSSVKPTAQYWSAIFLACVPMIVIAALVLYFLRMPGTFTSLYAGPAFIIILVYLLAADHNGDHRPFYKWFLTTYASLGYVVFSAYSIAKGDLSELAENMKDWIAVLVGLLFFVMIHIDTEVPATDGALAWIAYFLTIPLQMLFSVAMRQVLPLVFAAIAMFVCAWKIAREITRAMFGDALGGEETIVLLAILALQGIAIIVAAIAYAANRPKVDELVRTALFRCLRRKQDARTAEITV